MSRPAARPPLWGSAPACQAYTETGQGVGPKNGCGSKFNDRSKRQVLVHVSTYQGKPFWNSVFLSHSQMGTRIVAFLGLLERELEGTPDNLMIPPRKRCPTKTLQATNTEHTLMGLMAQQLLGNKQQIIATVECFRAIPSKTKSSSRFVLGPDGGRSQCSNPGRSLPDRFEESVAIKCVEVRKL